MMKKLLLGLIVSMIGLTSIEAQLNVTFRSNVPVNESVNDIWGWERNGEEYAIMGSQTKVTIIEVTDPDNPVVRAEVPGDASTWRDIKTHENYAYVTTDSGDDGLLIIDMSPLPDSIRFKFWQPDLPNLGILRTCHNLYIDEGYIYLAGCNVNGGGAVIIDVETDPWNPQLAGVPPSIYTHDNYARDNILYTSEIYRGVFTAYDVSDKQNIIPLASQQTEFLFTHNTWLSDDGNTIYTTDERANAPVGAYDISDFDNIKELDQFRPVETLGNGVVPHNVHVWNDYLIVSYYSDGCIIVDASRPSNLIEVGNFDTYIPSSTGFNGAWGAYPFLPSGTILVSDRQSGLYVLSPDYKRACWLEGTVTDADTGDEIEGVNVSIAAAQPNAATTDREGAYETGLATAGTYDVTYSALGYESQTISTALDNGVLKTQDVQLQAKGVYTGAVIDAMTGDKLIDGVLTLSNDSLTFSARANLAGDIRLVYEPGDYEVIAGAWGYDYNVLQVSLGPNSSNTFEVSPAYVDDFVSEYGWQVSGDATTGIWERGEPIGTYTNGGEPIGPEEDVDGDIGQQCYVTGNGGGTGGNDDVDGGLTRLTSPNMDLSDYNQPILNYSRWYYAAGGSGEPNDTFRVFITNGAEIVLLEEVFTTSTVWTEKQYDLDTLITKTATMNLIVEMSDFLPGHVVEAGLDAFAVVEGDPRTSTKNLLTDDFQLNAAPNPFNSQFRLDFQLADDIDRAELRVVNLLGQLVDTQLLRANTGQVSLGENWPQGTYFITLNVAGQNSRAIRVVKLKE